MILVTSQARPPVCSRCHKEIAILITASTPRNRRPHIVQVAAAHHRAPNGDIICPACWPEHVAEVNLICAVAAISFDHTPQRLRDGDEEPVPESLSIRPGRNGAATHPPMPTEPIQYYSDTGDLVAASS